jgi:Na+-translocating ferredoxin:NAD+ oxidoreductase subunit E
MKKQLPSMLFENNPLYGCALGLCPALAITMSLKNALAMGLVACFVLAGSSIAVSLSKQWVPFQVRIPCYLTIISTFVSIADIFLQAKLPSLSASLGIYIPLLAINCIIIARAETFASKNTVRTSLADALLSGAGFGMALIIISLVREITGNNTLLGARCIPHIIPFSVMQSACGGFFSFAIVLAMVNIFKPVKGRNS